jgi:hypothetical protein
MDFSFKLFIESKITKVFIIFTAQSLVECSELIQQKISV